MKSTRRSWLKTTAAMAGSLLVGGGASLLEGCPAPEPAPTPRPRPPAPVPAPNVILITADDIGWHDIGAYGNTAIATPHIDKLATEGVKFTNAFVTASSCSPSRASLITGQYPHTNGVDGLTHAHIKKALPQGYTTLASLLSKAGYHTGIEGKWHVAPFHPTDQYGYTERLSGILPSEHHIEDTTKTLDFLKRNKNKRFYLEINYMNNHRDSKGEFHFDPAFPVDPDKIKVPDYWTLPNWPEIRQELARYYSQTMKMDAMIGEVLGALDEHKIAENTLVVFISDNGPPFPGNKMTLYDRGIGTPLLFRWPALLKGGVHEGMVNSIDVMPTILEAAKVSVPSEVQGTSLYSRLKEPTAEPLHDAIYTEMTYHREYIPSRSVRTSRWKYIRNYSNNPIGLDQNRDDEWAKKLVELPNQPWTTPKVQEELYDLQADPHEQTNLATSADHKEQLTTLQAQLDAHMKETKDPYLGKPFTMDYKGG